MTTHSVNNSAIFRSLQNKAWDSQAATLDHSARRRMPSGSPCCACSGHTWGTHSQSSSRWKVLTMILTIWVKRPKMRAVSTSREWARLRMCRTTKWTTTLLSLSWCSARLTTWEGSLRGYRDFKSRSLNCCLFSRRYLGKIRSNFDHYSFPTSW